LDVQVYDPDGYEQALHVLLAYGLVWHSAFLVHGLVLNQDAWQVCFHGCFQGFCQMMAL
jgi:hypothetical protein